MKLSKDKRNKLIMVAVGTLAAVIALWFFLLQAQEAGLADIRGKILAAEDRELRIKQGVKLANTIQAQLEEAEDKMEAAEKQMASGDLYSWMYNTIKDFKAGYRVEIPQFSGASAPTDCTLIYKFPYKQTQMTINGNGYFHDIGKFVASFENTFPQMRIQNLDLSPGVAGSSDHEKLSFRMDIIALVKTAETK